MRTTFLYKKQKIFILALLAVLNLKGYSEELINENKSLENNTTIQNEVNKEETENVSEVSNIPSETELKFMRDSGLISEEDYLILLDELKGIQDEEMLYSLNVEGMRESNGYRIEAKENKIYFPLYSFLEAINLRNYENIENRLLIKLGDSLKEVLFDFEKNTIKTDNAVINFEDKIFIKDKEVYVEGELFKYLFLTEYSLNKERYIVHMNLNFTAPKNIEKRLNLKEEELKESKNENEIIYTNSSHFFDLGYARVNLDKSYTKTENGETSHDWGGNIEYQGDALYGNLITSYDIKEKKLGNIEIEYPDIWKQHVLKVGSYTAGENERELGLSFRKDKGFYENDKTFIIKERVPIGSRVELIYMGFTIEIQDAEEGTVEFKNKEIKADREYELKIYSPDGKIETRIIKTADDYNLQNRDEVEYDFNIQEDSTSKKLRSSLNMFYGLTDNLTTGVSYDRDIEEINDKFEYVNTGRGELIYSNYIKKFPFVLRAGGEKSFDKYKDYEKNYEDRYKHDYLGEITVDDLKFTFQNENFGKYYDEKRKNTYEVQYSVNNWGTIGYEYETTKKYSGEVEKDSEFTISTSKTYKSLMTTLDYSQNRSGNKEYGVNFYFTGFDGYSIRWENRLTEENGESSYETEATLYNNNYRGKIDYSLSAGYSEKYKDKISLNFTLRFDNWLELAGDIDKKRNQRYTAGIDKVFDLKNIRKKVDNMNVSRVKVITFIDENNNNIYDKGEKKIPDVEVSIGKDKVITDKNGEGMFYGISNSIVYELNPKIKKPSFTQGNNKIKVRGRTSSTINAYIPIKPMMTLSGKIEFDKILSLTDREKEQIYNDILIKIKDKDGKEIELTMPDNTGEFDVSGLFPDNYSIEILYTGLRYSIRTLNEKINLAYDEETEGTKIVFVMSDKKISMNNKEK